MAQYTHQKHPCMAFAFGIIKIYLHTFHSSRTHLRSFLHAFFISCGPRIRWQVYFLLSAFDAFPSFDLNILDKQRKNEQFSLSPLSMHGHTRVRMLMRYFIATLTSHVLSSSQMSEDFTRNVFRFEIWLHKNCFPFAWWGRTSPSLPRGLNFLKTRAVARYINASPLQLMSK